jgi:hypothetical protein
VATIAAQQVVVITLPLSGEAINEVHKFLLRTHRDSISHWNGLDVRVRITTAWTARENTRTAILGKSETPFLAIDLHGRMERACIQKLPKNCIRPPHGGVI